MDTDAGYFGERVAATYDEHSGGMFDPEVVGPAVRKLAELADGGAALEFAIGTGRIAIPLAERGVRVAGIDTSGPMLAHLRAKPGAERIEAVVGDRNDAIPVDRAVGESVELLGQRPNALQRLRLVIARVVRTTFRAHRR